MKTIILDKNNRMFRIGFGKNNGHWFFRVDLWFKGYRFTKWSPTPKPPSSPVAVSPVESLVTPMQVTSIQSTSKSRLDNIAEYASSKIL